MRILAIDPGSRESAWTLFESTTMTPLGFSISANEELVERIRLRREGEIDWLAIEVVKSYGNVMGDDVLRTVEWIGRFTQAYGDDPLCRLTRKEIVTALCGHSRAKDKNVRQAVIDFYGGKKSAIGTKKDPGKIYGAKRDIFSALAVAIVFSEHYSAEFFK